MWQPAILALMSASPAGQGVTFDGVAFGPQRTLSCTWFTNFENSRFEQCRDATGPLLGEGDGASIKCRGDTCRQLDAAAREASGWRKAEPPWGNFTVQLVGRVSLAQHKKRYLGDASRDVLIERLVSVRVLK